ncbi:AI-2E family transporter [Thiocapsa bogorovii]|uniref:AI-2E family transporter n=1 Tax=Thiocapsa bogorovii TaxID=521689 RepID=UPI001E2BA3BF|nr:AI-2E family transporter [Thiocapsa bogorovii]UHD14637.1 AI-2E family transporter [Thiocapsa bogorovii]
MGTNPGLGPATRFLVALAAFIIVVAGMRAAASLMTPFLLAVFIAVIATPPLRTLRERGAPNWAAMLLVVLAIAGLGSVLAILVAGSLDGFNASLPEYQDRLKLLIDDLARWLDGIGFHTSREALQTYIDPARVLEMAGDLVSGLSGVLANAFLILLTVVFILLEAAGLPAKLRAALTSPETSTKQLRVVLDSINRYMGIKSLTSLGTGLVIWAWLTILGVDYAVLWALIAFLLNFVPTIGSILAAIPAVLLALVQIDLQSALLVALGYLVVNTLVGSILEPKIMGYGLGLSTLVVFVSLVFWGWVLGPVGMFLSVPLTMSLKIALDTNPQTRPIAILLGPEIREPQRDPQIRHLD